MQNDAGEGGIAVVMMGLPILREDVNFDIARARLVLAELQDSAAEIGAGLVIPKARMEHAHRLASQGAEIVAAEALMVPEVLQEAFGRMRGGAFAQEETSLLFGAPLGVKVRTQHGHEQWFSIPRQSQGGTGFPNPRLSRIHSIKQEEFNAKARRRSAASRNQNSVITDFTSELKIGN
jgi:hypothetical protein